MKRTETVYADEKDQPRWYRMSFRPPRAKRPPMIVFKLTDGCADHVRAMLRSPEDVPMIGAYSEAFTLGSFSSNVLGYFGFKEALFCEGFGDGHVYLSMPLTPAKDVHALSASVSVLCTAMDRTFEKARAGADKAHVQMLTLNPLLRVEERFRGFHGAPMGGETSFALTRWLCRQYERRDKLAEVDNAILEAYCAFIGRKNWREMSKGMRTRARSPREVFRQSCNIGYGPKGSFSVRCPGNACEVGTYPDFLREAGKGYRLGCHNLDSPQQQLALLAGLSQLYDLAALDLDHTPPR